MSGTIYALASGRGRSGIAVVRVSGREALQGALLLTGKGTLPPRHAVFTTLTDPETGDVLDQALAIFFAAPASFTGEDVVEYHVHGGAAVVEGLLRSLAGLAGHRLAEPGEFTRRAFENGKLDLTEAEAVADLIAAETAAQRRQALDQLGGSLSRLYQGWSDRLQKILAHQEADIEFPDEDMPEGLSETLKPAISALAAEIRAHLDDGRRGERMREGLLVAIIGAPNAGKSSLLNALAGRDAAIVSDEAGTTRDVIEVHMDLGGYPVTLADTAGLRETGSKVEAEGIRRASALAARADIRIALFDGTQDVQDAETLKHIDGNTLVVSSKRDLSGKAGGTGCYSLSSATGEGMEDFLAALTEKARSLFGKGEGPALTRERHRLALQETLSCLGKCAAATLPELAAEDLRLALRALGRITGRVHVEELLDRIFRDFCIGK